MVLKVLVTRLVILEICQITVVYLQGSNRPMEMGIALRMLKLGYICFKDGMVYKIFNKV